MNDATQLSKYELLIWGYIRKLEKEESFTNIIPISIYELIHELYPKSWLLRFSDKYKSKKDLILSDNNTKVKTKGNWTQRFILCDVEPIHEGIHCWRISIYNPSHTDQIFWGISKPSMFGMTNPDTSHSTHDFKSVWGQISNGWPRMDGKADRNDGFKIKRQTIDRYQIDMIFDCDNGTLNMGVVIPNGKNQDLYVDGYKISNKLSQIPKITEGYVPHFIIYALNTELRVAKIEQSMFMKHDKFLDELFKK